jgi:hypothetical protein
MRVPTRERLIEIKRPADQQMASLMTFLTQNCCRGMPQECLDVVETALGRCCAPGKRKAARSRT